MSQHALKGFKVAERSNSKTLVGPDSGAHARHTGRQADARASPHRRDLCNSFRYHHRRFLSKMLRLGVFTVARPAAAAARPCFQARMFSQASRPNVLGALRSKPRATLSFFSARTLMNDAKPVYGQSQARTTDWRRVGLTVVSVAATIWLRKLS